MITRLEATRYRCFERLGVDVGAFQVLVGANGSGKSTLLDLPVLLGDLLRSSNISLPFMERRAHLPARASRLNELVFAERGSDFSFAIEAKLPEAVQTKVLEGMFARLKSEKSKLAFHEDKKRWPTHIRYELGLRIFNERELHVINEYLFLFPEHQTPNRTQAGFHGVSAKNNKHWRSIFSREFGHEVEFTPEVSVGGSRASIKSGLSPLLLAMPRVMFESEAEYPAARWLHNLLMTNAVFLEPHWTEMRKASPPGQAKNITSDGRNIPWLALDLKREGALKDSGSDYRSEAYVDWIAHVKTALPQVTDIEVREREDDHHAYFVLTYRGDFKVHSSGLSDGTLRILTLTLMAYVYKQPAILVTEEPENGIHPQAITAVMQSLSSLYGSQVFVSSHSPLVLANTEAKNLLCAQLSSDGGVEIISGDKHPHLMEWKGAISLGTLFAAGVLG
jgi:energy-coupling factor transporter ATP-binding protein EcfA2